MSVSDMYLAYRNIKTQPSLLSDIDGRIGEPYTVLCLPKRLYTNGRKTTYLYEAIFLVNEGLKACISNDMMEFYIMELISKVLVFPLS